MRSGHVAASLLLAGLALAALTVPAAAAPGAAISFGDQATSGRIVLVDAVQLPEGGFVVVHDPSTGEGDLGEVIGHSILLGAGQHNHVPVTLDRNVTESETLIAAVYKDANSNQEFDLGDGHGHHDHEGSDEVYTDGDAPIGDRATVDLYGTESSPRSTTPWTTLSAGAGAAIASLVFWAVRVR